MPKVIYEVKSETINIGCTEISAKYIGGDFEVRVTMETPCGKLFQYVDRDRFLRFCRECLDAIPGGDHA